MDEEKTESQTGEETQANDNSPFGGFDPNQTLGSALKTEEESTEESEDETQAGETKETSEKSTEGTEDAAGNDELSKAQKKAADAEAGLKKWKTISKDLIKQMKETKSGEQGEGIDEDFKELHQLLKKELAPLQQKIMEQEQAEVLNEIAEMPYTKELGPEIKTEFDKLDHITDYRARIETARAFAIAKNAHLLAEIGKEAGMQEAYSNQNEKKAQKGSGERSAAQTGDTQTGVLDKLKGGMSTEDFRANSAEIDKELKAMLGI